MKINRKVLIGIFAFLIFSFFAGKASAELEIIPHVIDEKAKASEIIEKTVKLKNNFEYKVNIYPIVNDLSETEGKQEFIDPSLLDKSTSLARWIKIQRAAVQLMPGEEAEIPLKIEVNLNAVPGKRFAVISFPHGPNQYEAEDRIQSEAVPQLTISVEVEDERLEKAQLMKFISVKNTYLGWPAEFSVLIKNIGNVDLTPSGSLYVYDRRERLLDKIALDDIFGKVTAESEAEALIPWDRGSGMGKFKARLELEYGENEKRDLADTVYFWVLPLSFLLIFIGGIAISVFVLVYYLFKKTYVHNYADSAEDSYNEREEIIDLKSKK